jgi:hypothetical protein
MTTDNITYSETVKPALSSEYVDSLVDKNQRLESELEELQSEYDALTHAISPLIDKAVKRYLDYNFDFEISAYSDEIKEYASEACDDFISNTFDVYDFDSEIKDMASEAAREEIDSRETLLDDGEIKAAVIECIDSLDLKLSAS